MRYGSIYLIVRDFDKSLSFYEKVFDMKVSAASGKRFAQFHNQGLNLCLMNGHYDSENPDQVVTKGEYWEIYDNQSEIANSINTRKVFINLGVEDLKALQIPDCKLFPQVSSIFKRISSLCKLKNRYKTG